MKRTWFVASLCSLALISLAPGCLDTAGELKPPGNQGGADAGPGGSCPSSQMSMFYVDSDGDGYGDPGGGMQACSQPVGYVANSGDCDDSMAAVYPGAAELCGDEVPNDCAGSTDACVANLTAHWSFDDQIGPNAVDYSMNGHTGVLQGGLQHVPESELVFDGVDDYVEVPHSPAFELASGTVAFWFMPDAVGVRQSMLSKDSSGNDAGGHLSFYLEADGTVRVRLQSNNASYEIVTTAPIAAGTWTHVGFAWGGTEGMKLYVDGALVGSNPYTGGLLRNLEPLAIGAGTDASGDLVAQPISSPFAGRIADVQIYDRKLLPDELAGVRTVSAPAPM